MASPSSQFLLSRFGRYLVRQQFVSLTHPSSKGAITQDAEQKDTTPATTAAQSAGASLNVGERKAARF
jgi:hypothetical protein